MSTAPHWDAVKFCTRAAVGDVGIALIAFWGTAAARSRHWICAPSRAATTTFVLIGLALTIVLERLATGPLERWGYSDLMPVVPALGVGLVPLMQWVVLPLALVWLVRRQLVCVTGPG